MAPEASGAYLKPKYMHKLISSTMQLKSTLR